MQKGVLNESPQSSLLKVPALPVLAIGSPIRPQSVDRRCWSELGYFSSSEPSSKSSLSVSVHFRCCRFRKHCQLAANKKMCWSYGPWVVQSLVLRNPNCFYQTRSSVIFTVRTLAVSCSYSNISYLLSFNSKTASQRYLLFALF